MEIMTRWADAGLFPSQEAMRDHLLIGLLQEGAPIPPDYPERLAEAGIALSGDWFGLVELQVVAVDAFAYIRGLGQTAYSEAQLAVNISERLKARLSGQEDLFLFKVQSEIMCIVCGADQGATARRLSETAEAMLALEQEVEGVRLFGAASHVLAGMEGLAQANRQVRQLFEYRALHLDITPLLTAELLDAPAEYPSRRADIQAEQAILSDFKSGRYRQAMEQFGQLFDEEYLALANPLILLKHKCAQYLDALVAAARTLCGSQLDRELEALRPEGRLLEASAYPELRARMEHIFGQLNDLVLSMQQKASTEWIAQVQNYIRGHYSDPDLNVNHLADAFGRNPSYLSRSFLRLTGDSVLDYIHRYRIQEAKILIGRGETLAAAAEAVGYSNVLTMSRAFKKYEGTTPGKLKG